MARQELRGLTVSGIPVALQIIPLVVSVAALYEARRSHRLASEALEAAEEAQEGPMLRPSPRREHPAGQVDRLIRDILEWGNTNPEPGDDDDEIHDWEDDEGEGER